jgi:cell division protein FtsB
VRVGARVWLFVLGPLLAAVIVWGWWRGVAVERETRRELVELQAKKRRVEETNRVLAREVAALSQERAARERAAREGLDVAAAEEIIVVLPATPTPGTR